MKINYQSGNALRHLLHTSLLAASLLALSGNAQAATVNNDLVGPGPTNNPYPQQPLGPGGTATGGTSTTINGTVFTVAPLNNTGTGTGAFNPFLRTHENGNSDYEVGFNTDAGTNADPIIDPINDNVGGIWTHSVKLSSLTSIAYNNNQYIQLFLDLGEPDANEKPLLSTLELELWVNAVEGNDNSYGNGLGSKIWDLDGLTDTTLNLDYNIIQGGNGQYDLIALFDAKLFANYKADDYFYLYNVFGKQTTTATALEYASEGTFEEWAFDTTGNKLVFGCANPTYAESHKQECDGGGGNNSVPEPTELALLGIGFLGMALARRNLNRA